MLTFHFLPNVHHANGLLRRLLVLNRDSRYSFRFSFKPEGEEESPNRGLRGEFRVDSAETHLTNTEKYK